MSLLSHLTILSLEQATALPFLTQRLARDGMRVIRVEPPGRGDPNRYIGRPTHEVGMNIYFLPNNCGKQAITLNLAEPRGQALLCELIAKLPVDIFATNNRPSSYAKLGIAYETLRAIKSDLIWLGISGFGPGYDEAAYDPVIQARAGWMDLTGEPDSFPQVFGLPMVDLGAAEHAYGAVMKALYKRAISGEGSRLDISMFHSAVSWMVNPLMLTRLGEQITRRGNTHQFFGPVAVFPTRDGFVYIAIGNDKQWANLMQLPAFQSLARPEYEPNAGRMADLHSLHSQIAAITHTLHSAELIQTLQQIGVPVAQVNTLQDVLNEPILRDSFSHAHNTDMSLDLMLPPTPDVSDPGLDTLTFPPRLGEHNQAIYGELLRYTNTQLNDLHMQGII
ncbi:MAG TPA: CoA transferase [Anaerolineae bacterium]|nr:CoA transferase [Anaerolineae bacterium]